MLDPSRLEPTGVFREETVSDPGVVLYKMRGIKKPAPRTPTDNKKTTRIQMVLKVMTR